MAQIKSRYKETERVVVWVKPHVRDSLKILATKKLYRSISSLLEDIGSGKVKLIVKLPE